MRYTYRREQEPGRDAVLQTQFRYTSQWFEDGLGATSPVNVDDQEVDRGLYFYGARWYDGSIARFIQPDTIVPEPGNPQSLNRYSYANNSPIVYNDPSGHEVPSFKELSINLPSWVTSKPKLMKGLAVGCFFLSCHVDQERGVLSGPTSEEQANMVVAGPAMLIGGGSGTIFGKLEGKMLTEGVERAVPLGFKNADEFLEFGSHLKGGLDKAGYEGSQAVFQGSSVTGVKYTTRAPFDVGRVSDFDIALTGSDLLQKAKDIGIGLRSLGTRTGPLTKNQLNRLGLLELQKKLSQFAGKEVNFVIFDSIEAAINRSPSIIVP